MMPPQVVCNNYRYKSDMFYLGDVCLLWVCLQEPSGIKEKHKAFN